MPELKKRRTSNGITKDPKKSRQDDPPEESSEEIPRELAVEIPQPGTSRSNACNYTQIIVTGPQGCGRSSLVCSYMEQLFPPKGGNFLSKQYLKVLPDKPPVMIWDLDAREEFKEYRKKSYPEADVALLCFDVKKPQRVERQDSAALNQLLGPWYKELEAHCGENIKIILVGLKKDLRNNQKFNEQDFFSENDKKYVMQKNPKIVQENPREVSAYTEKDGVKALFEYAISIAEPQRKQMFASGGFEIVN